MVDSRTGILSTPRRLGETLLILLDIAGRSRPSLHFTFITLTSTLTSTLTLLPHDSLGAPSRLDLQHSAHQSINDLSSIMFAKPFHGPSSHFRLLCVYTCRPFHLLA